MTHFLLDTRCYTKPEKKASKRSTDTCSTCSSSSSDEFYHETRLSIILTKKGLQVYGAWSKERLLQLLADRIKQCVQNKQATIITPSDETRITRLKMTVYSGLYSVGVLKEIQSKGMSLRSIMKAMKLGLISLSPEEIHCYKQYNVTPYALEFEEMWSKEFSEELILNLTPIGLNETECWNIIVHGVFLQSPYVIRHLTLSGVDVSGIINWQTEISTASAKVIEFLRLIGIDEEVVVLVIQHGIDEETEQMLVDLGLNDMDERLSTVEVSRKYFYQSLSTEIICECSLTILEPICGSDILKTVCKMSSKTDSPIDSVTSMVDDLHGYSCRCHVLEELRTDEEINARRHDYLRQCVMAPLSWAMARTLKYKPSDPIHFISYQLLRWVHGNVPENRKEDLRQLIALSTIAMDKRLVAKTLAEEEERIRKKNLEALRNIPCEICKELQALRRVKEQCWKCVKRRVKKFGVCDFPDVCSSCKINVSSKSDLLSDTNRRNSQVRNLRNW